MKYDPNWESLDKRAYPQWFEQAKFGVFIHWGLYSVPSFGRKDQYAEWYWYYLQEQGSAVQQFHEKTYGRDFSYQHFVPLFTAEMFDSNDWAALLKRSGAGYVVLTSKHHEGFCLWPNQQSWNWNSVDTGPRRDLCGELIEVVRGAGLRMGYYYSLYEWFNPLYLSNVDQYVDQHMLPQFKDLVQRYGPDIVWTDGEWDHPAETWRSTEFLAWLFNDSGAPEDVAIGDRWGKDTRNLHGGFATPEYGHLPEGRLVQLGRWEETQGMGTSFGYNRQESIDDYRSSTELVHLLVDVVSRGGNLLLDIGPTADGRIPVIMQQRLIDMGNWLQVNGEAIYGTRVWRVTSEGKKIPQRRGKFTAHHVELQEDMQDSIHYTATDDALYAICLQWPGDTLELTVPKSGGKTKVHMLGLEEALTFTVGNGPITVSLPVATPDSLPCQHAYVLKLTGVE